MAKRKSYPGHIRRRGDSWQLVLQVAGERHQFTLRGDRKDVEAFAREQHAELEEQARRAAAGQPVGKRCSDLLKEFEQHHLPGLSPRSQSSYRESLRPVRRYLVDELGDPRIAEVRAAHIRHYLTWRRVHSPDGTRRKVPLHGRTLERDRAILHKMFAMADALEWREGNPVSRVAPDKYDTRQPIILTDAQFEALLHECEREPMLWLWTLLLNDAGLRSESEALHLKWDDIDLAGGWIEVRSGRNGHRTKSGKSRSVPMTARLRSALSEHAARYRLATYGGKRSEWVFHHTRTLRKARAGHRIKSLRARCKKAAERAGIPCARREDWTPHDLRHRRATTWIAAEKNVHHVQEAMGHSVIQTTMRYTHLAKEHLRSLVDEPESRHADAVGQD
jgi:site-specific recombinase XerD